MLRTVAVFILLLGLVACQSHVERRQTLREIEAVRLVGGHNEREGRLEVMSHGQWGSVCDDLFDNNAATVVCRSLGFQSQRSIMVEYQLFRMGTGAILLNDVVCTGNETSLNECRGDVGDHGEICQHQEDVNILCGVRHITGMRLVGGTTPREGRLDVEIAGVWGTVCDDSFDSNDARVVCRELGFPSGNAHAIARASFGSSSGPILLDDVNCSGDESNLEHCEVRYVNNCSHNEDVSVICA